MIILTSSGTGAMEASLVSLHEKGDEILVVDGGKFGERFHSMSKSFGLVPTVEKVAWGDAVSVESLRKTLQSRAFRSLCIQACETSTGTHHPIEDIAKMLRESSPQTLLIVDGITAIGATPMPMDSWGIDCLISGSQKAFMMPPGLSFIGLSARAAKRIEDGGGLPRFYFDLRKELKSQSEGATAFTPATILVEGLLEALAMMNEEGLDRLYERHRNLARATRKGLEVLGLSLASRSPCVACSAAFLPAGVDGRDFLKALRERYGFTVAGGQDQWEGRVLRLSHLGYYSPFDLLSALTAIGRELQRRHHPVDLSKALTVFMDELNL